MATISWEFKKGYAYALSQEKVDCQLDLVSLKEENKFLRSQDPSNVDIRYNEKRMFVLEARLKAIFEIESHLK